MGSTRKHKEKEPSSRKRKSRRSASKSPSPDREHVKEKDRERHHKRHHREKRRERTEKSSKNRSENIEISDNEDDGIPIPPPPKISRPSTPPPPAISQHEAPSSRSDSLSIGETNKLRARLGLKPLQSAPEPVSNSVKSASELAGGTDMGEFVHKPAESITARTKQDKVKQRITDHREKRKIDSRLAKVKTLGESDDEEDISAWVIKSRAMQIEKDKADKRAKMLEELDAEFGVGALVEEETRADRRDAYTARDLRGMKVEHAADGFDEGRTVILTLKDSAVLADDGDVLINVNMIDDERYKKNIAKKKANPFGYNALDDADSDDGGRVPDVLSKYDEEIDGEKLSSFAIGEDVSAEMRRRALQKVRAKLHKKTAVSLIMPALQIASEYYTPEEIKVKFNKTKKKVRKTRKKLKADDLKPLPGRETETFGSRNKKEAVGVKVERDDAMEVDNSDGERETADIKVEVDDGEVELQQALTKARRLLVQQVAHRPPRAAESAVAAQVASSAGGAGSEDLGGYITLNATAEFCRTLGDIPTYGLAGNRDEDTEELLDYEREMNEEKKRLDDEGYRGAWNAVAIDERPVEVSTAEVPILDAEPDLGMGVAGALRLAVSKGYLEREDQNKPSASRFAHLNAQNYSIEDKTHIDDDKFGRRERYSGPTSDFKEKSNFQPNVKLDYIDDDGHILNAKEAFRYLSHKFHGKGPGKNKVEKRMKKNEQEGLMKCMSSTDTPLGTLNLLQQKQKETQSAFVVLSGTKQATSISKTKL